MMKLRSIQTDLSIIKRDLCETELRNGACLKDYEIFKDIYRFVARGISRTGQTVYVLLCTLTDEMGNVPDIDVLDASMECLNTVIRITLRRGDLYARYSSTQYVILLPGTAFENSWTAAERIEANFTRSCSNGGIILHCQAQPLDPIFD